MRRGILSDLPQKGTKRHTNQEEEQSLARLIVDALDLANRTRKEINFETLYHQSRNIISSINRSVVAFIYLVPIGRRQRYCGATVVIHARAGFADLSGEWTWQCSHRRREQ